ncbi:MAG: hypothetical protein NT007_09265 [Candidatus Kapabacteria bacterium]|nr:hypothetical protein [Candidatus Kapabacteria bacterium]
MLNSNLTFPDKEIYNLFKSQSDEVLINLFEELMIKSDKDISASLEVSEKSFIEWGNPEDEIYNLL